MKLKHLFAIAIVSLLCSCGGGGGEKPGPKEKETRDLACEAAFIYVGQADQAPKARIVDSYDDIGSYTLESQDSSIVSIVNNKLHAVSLGTTTITISKDDDDNYKYNPATFKATVFEPLAPIDVDPFDRTYTKIQSDSIYVRKVENMTDQNYIIGMDISSVISMEEAGVKYYDFDGQEKDLFEILSANGINYIRVRIWNDPYDKDGHSYGGGHNDLATAIQIGKRATAHNMSLLVNFHYSDFWADPSRQKAPKAWLDMLDVDEKAQALYQFTKDSLQAMKDENIKVGMVQIGNENNGVKVAGEDVFVDSVKLFKAGSRACREVFPNALVALHFANPEKSDNMLKWADQCKDIDYDVFGSSYYPYWHGTLENLSYVLSTIAAKYNKRVMVLETSYCFSGDDYDYGGNTIGETSGYDKKDYPFTLHGQINHLVNVTDTIINHTANGLGICYWEGAWISAGGNSWEANRAKWEQYGCGWAASYAHEYDAEVGEGGGGGTMVDNQTFFRTGGHPLESLKVFNLMRFGNVIENGVDSAEDVELVHYDTDDFTLPETVNAIYYNNDRKPIPVTWEAFDIDAAKARGNAKYVINGVAGGYTVHCRLTIMEYNFAENYSFETGTYGPWKMTTNDTLSSTHIIKVTNENPQTGKYAAHFWTSDATGVNFEVTQTFKNLSAGKYKLQISALGGGLGSGAITPSKQNVYIFIKVNGTLNKTQHTITKYGDGYKDIVLRGVNVPANATVEIGFHVQISEANCWGDFDDVMFNHDN